MKGSTDALALGFAAVLAGCSGDPGLTDSSGTTETTDTTETTEAGVKPVCGDGTCLGKETCSSCPADCGTCDVQSYCGNGTCDANETCSSCPADCDTCNVQSYCGDGTCDANETCSTCAGDCGSCPQPSPSSGIWISKAELAVLPTSGSAWTYLESVADKACTAPYLEDQEDFADQCAMAKALVFARTGTESYRTAVESALAVVANYGTYAGRALALGRNLAQYALAADLVDLPTHDPSLHAALSTKFKELLVAPTTQGGTLVSCSAKNPTNWGAMCLHSRIAVDRYLGDTADLATAAAIFRGYTGDYAAYAGFAWSSANSLGASSWAVVPEVPINPKGATIDGHNVDGADVGDMYRGGAFQWPPVYTSYPWGALWATIASAEMLFRAGYDAYAWSDSAILRYVKYLAYLDDQFGTWFDQARAGGASAWVIWIVNKRYKTTLPAAVPARAVGNGTVGWTDWTHQ